MRKALFFLFFTSFSLHGMKIEHHDKTSFHDAETDSDSEVEELNNDYKVKSRRKITVSRLQKKIEKACYRPGKPIVTKEITKKILGHAKASNIAIEDIKTKCPFCPDCYKKRIPSAHAFADHMRKKHPTITVETYRGFRMAHVAEVYFAASE